MHDSAFALELADEGSPLSTADQPSERLERHGAGALSDTELLTILLQGGGMPSDTAQRIAAKLLAETGSVAKLLSWTPAEFRRIGGIGPAKAVQLAATVELGRRMLMSEHPAQPLLNRADAIYAYLRPLCAGLTAERVYVLSLNRKNRLLKLTNITLGTATAALLAPREVFRQVILDSGTAVVVAHNHPSGDPAPSAPDINITRLLREAAKTVDIELLDHVIVGNVSADPLGKGYYSFREAGLL